MKNEKERKYKLPEVRIMTVREMILANNPILDLPEKVAAAAYDWFDLADMDMDREHLLVFCLNIRNRIVGVNHVATGTADSCLMSPLEIFRPIIMVGSKSFILVHNHPSGDCSPSEADIRNSRELVKASKCMRLNFLDHVIIGAGDESYSSLRERGYLYDC